MPNEEYEKVKEALRKPETPEARKEAADAFRRYNVSRLARGRGSRPTLVSLNLKKGYPNAVPLENIPDELERNPEFYDLLQRVIAKEK